jgi:hypothetical protein
MGDGESCKFTVHSSGVALYGWTAIQLNAMSEPSLLVELREAIKHDLSTLLLCSLACESPVFWVDRYHQESSRRTSALMGSHT